MARPTKSRENRMTRFVTFRITDAEFLELASVAKKAGLRVNQLARLVTLDCGDRVVIKTHGAFDPALLKRLDKIGINLNQLVKNAHIFKRVSPQVAELCEKIDGFIRQAMDDMEDGE